MTSTCTTDVDYREGEALSAVLWQGVSGLGEGRSIRDREKDLPGCEAGCGGNREEEARDCPEAVHSTVAAKSSEAETLGHMQRKEKSCLGCTVCNAGVQVATELEQMGE